MHCGFDVPRRNNGKLTYLMESKAPMSIAPRVLSRLVTVAYEAEDIARFGNLNGSQAPPTVVCSSHTDLKETGTKSLVGETLVGKTLSSIYLMPQERYSR
jgi:hypothetical protein